MHVVVVDDFRTGRREFIEDLLALENATLVEGDVLDKDLLEKAFTGCDWIFHLQANADVRRGLEHPTRDLEQNTVATSRVLEAMRATGVHRILFSSTGSVYGEPDGLPDPGGRALPLQTSLYGASKLSCEGLVAAYASGFDFTGVICRFVSILGERYTHGHVFDFYRSLRHDPSRLLVLGDGKQEKSYLYVQDCISAMLALVSRYEDEPGVSVYNLATDETVVVDDSVALIAAHMGCEPAVTHTGGARVAGSGTARSSCLDTTRIRGLGWAPTLTIREAIERTLLWFDEHDDIVLSAGEDDVAAGTGVSRP